MDNLYTEAYYKSLKQGSHRSAREIVPLVLELIHVRSVVDVGCGSGAWLSAFVDCGIEDYLGVDGDYVDKESLEIPAERFTSFDLRNLLRLDREFDLVVSVEVAEHLPIECADTFVDSLTGLGPVILFSAAIPRQGGTDHVNEQWPGYWVEHFEKRGYQVIDCIRPRIWHNEQVEFWYAQNLLLFVRQSRIKKYSLLEREIQKTNSAHLAMIHPRLRQRLPAKSPSEVPLSGTGKVHVVQVDVTQPIPDIVPSKLVEHLHCTVEVEGVRLGTLELPICDGLVPSYVLTDAIAADFAWPILGYFFERTIYPYLTVKPESKGLSLWRDEVCLVDSVAENKEEFWSHLHNRAGWTIFLQEIWGQRDWHHSHFYDLQARQKATTRCHVTEGWHSIEISEPLPDLVVHCQELNIVLMVGGVSLGVVPIPTKKVIQADQLRVAFLIASGYELCRAAVREGLLGQSFSDPLTLRERLAAAAVRQRIPWPAISGPASDLDKLSFLNKSIAVFGRRDPTLFGTSASRRANLPTAATTDLVKMAVIAGDPIIQKPVLEQLPKRVIYAPDLIQRPVVESPEQITGMIEKFGKLLSGNRLLQMIRKLRLS